MTKKIVAVGGGENGRLKSDGTRIRYPYELEKMDKEGQDLYTTLPILCKYLGHKNIEATEYYLLLAKDYFINITNKEELYYDEFDFLKEDDNE